LTLTRLPDVNFDKVDKVGAVAVRMVSEGVDVPRLCVGGYAPSASTPLFFAQAVGLLAAANRAEAAGADLDVRSFEALESEAEFDHVLFDAQQFGLNADVGSAAEQEYLGLPGLLEPQQVTALLRERQSAQRDARPSRAGRSTARPSEALDVTAHRALSGLRKELNALVSAYARKQGVPHAMVHADLRRQCGGPTLDVASSEQVWNSGSRRSGAGSSAVAAARQPRWSGTPPLRGTLEP